MARRLRLILCVVFCLTLLCQLPAGAVPPDFNADRRVNVKCPTSIDKDRPDQFELDGFQNTIRRLYHELDKNLWVSEKGDKSGYTFSTDPNEGVFYVCHAKAFFPAGRLPSLSPRTKIKFQEVFLIKEIDWNAYKITLVRQQDGGVFTIGIKDFETGFLWYNALLDNTKAYIPVYGFLSLPGEADAFPTIWNSWEGSRSDTATPPESLVDYDFYKILDQKNGYYLLGKDFNELDYRDNVEDYGIIGWVQKKYITLWRSRLYYSPVKPATFYNDGSLSTVARETAEINRFYVEHAYQNERLFKDIVEKIDQESLHRFYAHFGFPQLADPEKSGDSLITKVFVPGAFTPRLMRLLARSLKQNLNVFFLLDVSESMRPFADYVRSFSHSVEAMQEEGIGLRVNRIFSYWESDQSDQDLNAPPKISRVKRAEDLVFSQESDDKNYTEPLMRSLLQVLTEIETLQKKGVILPLHEKLLFIITDAGANDLTEEVLADVVEKAVRLNVRLYVIYPDRSGVAAGNPNLEDTPDSAYNGLKDFMALMETSGVNGKQLSLRKFQFRKTALQSEPERKKDFIEQQTRLLGGIKAYIDHVVGGGRTEIPKDVVLYFSDEQLLTEMRKWSDRKIQVLNHVVKYISQVDDPAVWEERIAIPAKPVETYLRAIRTQDDVSLSDLKKLVIINSLVSVDDIENCRKLYDNIKPLIERKIFKSADAVFYKALTNKEPGLDIRWNSALGENRGPLVTFLSQRGFHLNSFNQAVQRKFMFLKLDELYDAE